MNHQTSMPDEKLIQFYLDGDPNAMAILVELYKDRVFRSVYNIVQEKYVAEEIFQEVFISLINNMIAGKIYEDGNFLQWATRIAQNLCLEYVRKERQTIEMKTVVDELAEFSVPAILQSTSYFESHNRIKSMIDLLPDDQREVMLLNHYGGLGYGEIAELMKCSLNTALNIMKLGLNNLRKMMLEEEMNLNQPVH